MTKTSLSIFFLILLEYACFPVSSEIVLPASGLISNHFGTPFLLLVLLSTLAGVLGTSLTYYIGRCGGTMLLERITHRFPKTERSLASSQVFFQKHGKMASMIARVIPLCRTYIGFVAGAMKQPYLIYVLFSSLGILIWNTILLGLGYYFWSCRAVFFVWYERYRYVFLLLLSLVIIAFVFCRLRSKSKK